MHKREEYGVTYKIAVIGSGPAGFYTTEAVLKLFDDAEIDIIECLPTPFGLVRYGVAPDHQSIKNVARAFDRTAGDDAVRFFGNVQVGREVTMDELLALYDAVVLATGAALDRHLGIPGDRLPGVIGSAAFVGWYNCHPDHVDLDPDLDVKSVAVIGVGNVALDVARLLARSEQELRGTDTHGRAMRALSSSPVRDIHIIGRRGPLEATFTPQELKEFGEMERAVPLVDAAQLPPDADTVPEKEHTAKKKNLAILQGYAANRGDEKPVRVHFLFHARPMEILGNDLVEGIRLERTVVENGRLMGTGETFTLDVGLVVPCIGYRTAQIPNVPFDEEHGHFENRDGLVRERLYAAGWARRGPTGTIATNRADGQDIARHILDECTPDPARRGRQGLRERLAERNVEVISFTDWQLIDAAERQAALGEGPRVKFTSVDDMLHAAHPVTEGKDAAK